jgi:hypothetical protein
MIIIQGQSSKVTLRHYLKNKLKPEGTGGGVKWQSTCLVLGVRT